MKALTWTTMTGLLMVVGTVSAQPVYWSLDRPLPPDEGYMVPVEEDESSGAEPRQQVERSVDMPRYGEGDARVREMDSSIRARVEKYHGWRAGGAKDFVSPWQAAHKLSVENAWGEATPAILRTGAGNVPVLRRSAENPPPVILRQRTITVYGD